MAKTAFSISEPQQLAWAFRLSDDASLIDAANRFFLEIEQNGYLEQLKTEFFSGVKNFTIAGAQVFAERMRTTLPEQEALFRKIAEEAGMDWHLLAAMAYQESHWDAKAVSPTGVKGLMMLTRATAREVGIKNRLDPQQSLRGGARYFLHVKNRLADDIKEPDRTWFALAAYNVGMGHLEDARVLTERYGKDPHLWQDVREHLPLLQRQKYFSSVRHGYARGSEPVLYVKNIRKYMQMLKWNTIEQNRRQERKSLPEQKEVPSWDTRSFLTL